LEFAPGEWLLSSYIATGMENVLIFIKADNTEEEIVESMQDLTRPAKWAGSYALNKLSESCPISYLCGHF